MMATRRGLAVGSDDIQCYLHDRKYITRALRKRAQISSRVLDSMIADRSRFVTEGDRLGSSIHRGSEAVKLLYCRGGACPRPARQPPICGGTSMKGERAPARGSVILRCAQNLWR